MFLIDISLYIIYSMGRATFCCGLFACVSVVKLEIIELAAATRLQLPLVEEAP